MRKKKAKLTKEKTYGFITGIQHNDFIFVHIVK